MRPAEKRDATYADIEALPPHVVGEIVDGQLHVSPRPTARHARASSVLGMNLGGSFDRDAGPGGWWFLDEPELHFGKNVVIPDIAGWRRQRMPRIPDVSFLELAPDWLCEVLWPSTVRFDRVEKLGVYARAQVQHAWLVDPVAKSIEVFRLQGAFYSLVAAVAGETPVRLEPFDAIELDIAALWLPDVEPLAP